MGDGQLRTAIERLDTALARVEAALVRPTLSINSEATPLLALEQRHAALRQVMSDSVRELDTLLAAAETAPKPVAPTADSGS